MWSDAEDQIIGGDLTAALAYLTPAQGTVVTPVAPLGLRDREAGTVTFTTSLGFGRKLDRIKPHIKVWWTQATQSRQLLEDGEVDMIAIWNAHAQVLIEILHRPAYGHP